MREAYMTLPETARLLRLSEKSVYRLVQSGRLPGAAKVGGQWRFNSTKLMTWLDAGGEAQLPRPRQRQRKKK